MLTKLLAFISFYSYHLKVQKLIETHCCLVYLSLRCLNFLSRATLHSQSQETLCHRRRLCHLLKLLRISSSFSFRQVQTCLSHVESYKIVSQHDDDKSGHVCRIVSICIRGFKTSKQVVRRGHETMTMTFKKTYKINPLTCLQKHYLRVNFKTQPSPSGSQN